MAKPGVAPTPTKLKVLRGEKESRINRDEPPAPEGRPVPPLAMGATQRAVWDDVCGWLEAMGLLSVADAFALEALCEAVVAHRRAAELLLTSDVVITGAKGTAIRNPALTVMHHTSARIRMLCAEFGLTPSARSDIQMGSDRQAPRLLDELSG